MGTPSESAKVFISYSWSSEEHKDFIRKLAERLIGDGIDVVLDEWDLKIGDDKYAFMERMVTDPSVRHVLVFSDQAYAEKADARKPGGVCTESQIISSEVYSKVSQQKFIPIILEWKSPNEPYLPVFFKSRIGIDFSDTEKINENWEPLLRTIVDKPAHQKPALGTLPSYITEDDKRPALPTFGKFEALKHTLREGKPNAPILRRDFLNAACTYVENIQLTSQNPEDVEASTLLALYEALVPLRDQLVDWLSLDLLGQDDAVLSKEIVRLFERLRVLNEVRPNTADTGAHAAGRFLFLYELFLYFTAAMIQEGRLELLRKLLDKKYQVDRYGTLFRSFTIFSPTVDSTVNLAEPGSGKKVTIALLLKNHAHFAVVPYRDLVQADTILFLISVIEKRQERHWWCPHLIARDCCWRDMPFIQNAQLHEGFNKLALLLGVKTKAEILSSVDNILENSSWSSVFHHILDNLKDDGFFGKLDSYHPQN